MLAILLLVHHSRVTQMILVLIFRIYSSLDKCRIWAKQTCHFKLLEYFFALEEIIDKMQLICPVQIWNHLKLQRWLRQWKNKITDVYYFKQTHLTVCDVRAISPMSHVFKRFPSCLGEHTNDPLQNKNPFSLPKKLHTWGFFLWCFLFVCVKPNVTLHMMMLTVDFFSSLGSWSADRLRSAAELPCPVRLAADVRPSHSHCEDQQVGRGQPLPFGRGSSCRGTTVPASDSPCTQCGFPSMPAAAALWVLWASQAAGSTWLVGKILQGGGSVVSAWIFWVLSLPLCKLLDSKVLALDLPVTPLTCEMLPIWRKFTLFLTDVCLMLLIHTA